MDAYSFSTQHLSTLFKLHIKYTAHVSRNLCEPGDLRVRTGLTGQLGALLLQKEDSLAG